MPAPAKRIIINGLAVAGIRFYKRRSFAFRKTVF